MNGTDLDAVGWNDARLAHGDRQDGPPLLDRRKQLSICFHYCSDKGMFKHTLTFDDHMPPTRSFLAADDMPGMKDTTDAAGVTDYLHRIADTIGGKPWRLWEKPKHSERPRHLMLPDVNLTIVIQDNVEIWARTAVGAGHWRATLQCCGQQVAEPTRRDICKLLRSLAKAMNGNCDGLMHCYECAMAIYSKRAENGAAQPGGETDEKK